MARFENKFFKVLKEQDIEEKEAFEATLDDDTPEGAFDVDVEVDETVVEDDPNVKAAISNTISKIDQINELILDIPEDLSKIGI